MRVHDGPFRAMSDDDECQKRDDTEHDRFAYEICAHQVTSQSTIPRVLVVPRTGDSYESQPVKYVSGYERHANGTTGRGRASANYHADLCKQESDYSELLKASEIKFRMT